MQSAFYYLQSTFRDLMNEKFQTKTMRMSMHDPRCMTPLAKAKCRSPDGCPINLKETINAIVTENRKSLASGKMGSKA